MAIASIQSAATFPDPNVKYVFRTENGGQVRGGQVAAGVTGVGLEGGHCTCHVETWRARRSWGPFGGGGCSPRFGVEVGVAEGFAETSLWGRTGSGRLCVPGGLLFEGLSRRCFVRAPKL